MHAMYKRESEDVEEKGMYNNSFVGVFGNINAKIPSIKDID